MIVPEARQPLCESCSDEDGDVSLRRDSKETLGMLPLRGMPPILGVATTLSRRAKLAFLATNLPYFAVSAWFMVSTPANPLTPTCCATLCASGIFHGSLVALLASVSTYWHGAQCQLQHSSCRWLYCYSEARGSSALHSVGWLRRLVVADIACSGLTLLNGFICFGMWRTNSWMAGPFVVFAVAHVAKKRRQYEVYAIAHGIWHVVSAIAIFLVVLNGSTPFEGDAET